MSDWLIICLCPGFFDTRASGITNKMAADDVLFHCLLQGFFIATASCAPFFLSEYSGISVIKLLVIKLLYSLSLLRDRSFVGGFMHRLRREFSRGRSVS